MELNVVKNAKKNMLFGAINKIIVMLCPFVEKTVIVYILGAQYLGLSSLYTSILSVLSLTELGFGSAMIYNMYKPAADGDTAKLNALLSFYRKAYRIIGCVVLGLGLVIIPLLPHLIKDSYPADINLTKLYLIYLINASISYLSYGYLSSVLVVHQRNDISSAINTFVKILLVACQVVALLVTRNYYYFALLMPVFTIVNNLWTAWRIKKLFPQYQADGDIDEADRSGIRKLVAGTFIQQACSVTRNSLDSICISAFLGLTLTAIYNNYFAILTAINGFTLIINNSLQGGVGNHVATRSVSQNYEELKKLDFLYLWLGGWCTVCLLCLFQPFMALWMSDRMMLPFPCVCLLCVYFYLLKLGDMRFMYSSAKGLWWEQRYRALAETTVNVVLNILLGRLYGVYGIIIATIISLFFCNYLWSVSIVFKQYFTDERKKDYYRYQGEQSLVILVVCVLTYLFCSRVHTSSHIMTLIVRFLICLILPNCVWILCYHRTDRYRYAKNTILKSIRGR